MNTLDTGWRMPAEWTPHAATWMAFPHNRMLWESEWGVSLADVQQDFAAVANAIARFEPVKLVVDPAALDRAGELCAGNVELIELAIDDSWCRDSGPSFVCHPQLGLAGVSWRFNAWGGKSAYAQDASLARRILDGLGLECFGVPLANEGGAIHVDGEGTLITTESVLLNANRNPGLSKAEIEALFARLLGVTRTIWLPGDPDRVTGDMTDGHVDGVCAFARPGALLLDATRDTTSAYAEVVRENRRALERHLTLATTQFACSWSLDDNLDRAERLVREAAARGAQLVLLQELFATPYFCIEQDHRHLRLAETFRGSRVLARFSSLARELGVVLPLSWYERAGNARFNSLAVADADGRLLGVYRKAHVPNAIGYQEKEYFSPGDSGFRVWDTAVGRIGVGICWDQWFPETARCLALLGAEVLLFPTAIGSEPGAAQLDSRDHWQIAQRGQAAANLVPLVAANRIGREVACGDPALAMRFYGSSFIADHKGALLAAAGRDEEAVLVCGLDLDAIGEERLAWGVYRDRRPELYGPLMSLDGRDPASRHAWEVSP